MLKIADEAGTIRTIVSVGGSSLLIGTTKNEILQGDMKQGFSFVMQVNECFSIFQHEESQEIYVL